MEVFFFSSKLIWGPIKNNNYVYLLYTRKNTTSGLEDFSDVAKKKKNVETLFCHF